MVILAGSSTARVDGDHSGNSKALPPTIPYAYIAPQRTEQNNCRNVFAAPHTFLSAVDLLSVETTFQFFLPPEWV